MNPRRHLLGCLLVPVAAALLHGLPSRAAELGPIIAAASDLNPVLEEIARRFAAETGKRVRLVFGSSGNLQSQIRQGAPFELFLSADEALVQALKSSGRLPDEGVIYGVGRLALFVGKTSPVRADPQFEDLRAAVRDHRLKRLALANPEHAPYGRAAREALRYAELWDLLPSRLVFGENVVQAAQFAATGAAEAALVALSLTLAPRFRSTGSHALVPENWHSPLRQRMARVNPCSETATAFYAYLQTPTARAMLATYGFRAPE